MRGYKKVLVLGTAQWGWSVTKSMAFELLDAWIASGMREIDAATNYPINRNEADFRASEAILHEYIQAHGLYNELAITMKVGSMNNMRTPDINLSPSFLWMMQEMYMQRFGGNLQGIMVHWDNNDQPEVTQTTIESLRRIHETGLRPGLSGILHPALYAALNTEPGFQLAFDIELKHNIFHSDLARYTPLLSPSSGHRVLAYGINGGGLKLSGQYTPESTFLLRGGQPDQHPQKIARVETLLPKWTQDFVRPPVRTMNHIGMVYALLNPQISGIVIGAKTVAQIRESIEWLENTETFDYADVFKDLTKIAATIEV